MTRGMIGRLRPRFRVGVPATIALLLPLLGAACGEEPAGDAVPGDPLPLPSPAGAGAGQPDLFAVDGRVHLSWIEPTVEAHALRMATLDGEKWTRPRTIAVADDMFVNWADFPSLVETPDGTLWAHWLRRSGPGTYAYDVVLQRSDDGGESWEAPFSPHHDGTETEHGFVSLVPGSGGEVTAIWLDGRGYAGVDLDATAPPEGAMALRATTLGGAGAETDTATEVLDERVCDCCQTAAVGTGESLLVAYRDRSPEEIRDISVITRTENTWGAPVGVGADGWRIPGCPVNGPAMAAQGGTAVVAWFAMVDGTPEVKVAFTEDSGRSFSSPVVLERDGAGEEGRATLGRVDVEWIDDDTVLATWLTTTGSDTAEIRFRTVDRDGSTGPPRLLAPTHPGRSSGFPRITRAGNAVIAAWTVPGTEARIEMARIPLPATPATAS